MRTGDPKGKYHLVDCLNDSKHLLVRDLAIPVDIVKLECPVQLILHATPRRDRQRTDEFLEINHAAVIRIKHSEDIIGKRRGISEREELAINLLEFLLGQGPGRAVLEEACRPLVNHYPTAS